MRIKEFTLYKTKLSNNYNDVIDTGPDMYLNHNSYKNLLDSNYSPLIVYSGNVKSMKERDGIGTISIDKRYEDIVDYNYCSIMSDNKNYFYFITSKESLNDGDNPSCLLTLERDAWGNNIEELTNHIEDDRQSVIRSHKERFYDNGSNLFYPYYYLTNDSSQVRRFEQINYKNVGGSASVGWVGLRMSPDTKISIGGELTSLSDSGYVGCIPTEASAPVFYFPLFIIGGVSDGIPEYNFNFTWNGTSINNASSNKLRKVLNFFSDIFLEAFITLYPPFSYSATFNSVSTSGLTVSTVALFDTDETPVYNNDLENLNPLAIANTNTSAVFNFSSVYSNELTGFSPTDSVGSKVWEPYGSMDDVLYYEPRIYCSPFVDIVFKCSKFRDSYTPSYKTTTHTATISSAFRSSPSVRTTYGGQVKGEGQIETVGRLITTPNKFDSFLQNALMSTFLGGVSGAVQGAGGGLVGAAAGALSGIGSGVMNMFQGFNNINNTTTIPSVPSVLSSNNIKDMLPSYTITQWADSADIKDIVSDCYLYGYRYNEAKSIKNNVRLWFDYCQTVDCRLPNISNNTDREKLEAAFNRGVNKWHLQDGFGINSYFDKTRNNPERKYVSAEDAQISFDFTKDRPYENRGTLGNNITMDNITGTYQITENGLKLTTRTTAMIKSSSNLADYITFGDRRNSSTHQIKINEWDNNNTYGENVIMCNVPYNSNSANWYFYADATGALYIKINSAGGTYNLNANINDCIGKTLTISYSWTGYSIATSLKFYIDDVEIFNASNLGQATSSNIITLGYPSNYNAGMTIKKVRSYYYPNELKVWTAEEARTHLI